MTATAIRIDETTSMTREISLRLLWMIAGLFWAYGAALEHMEAEGGGDIWGVSMVIYGIFVAVYAVLPEIGQLLSVYRDREEIEASRWYAGGFHMALGGLFLVQGAYYYWRAGGSFTVLVLLWCAAAAAFFISPFFPKLFGPLHVTVDEDRITARTSYFFRTLRRRWPDIERIEISSRAVRLVTHEGQADKISLKKASDEQAEQITSALTDVATAKGVPVDE